MNQNIYDAYLHILQEELLPALGCTEPIAVAYAAAKARETLGVQAEKMSVVCSGNIVKNVMGVVVPNSDGNRGIAAAAILGMLVGNGDRKLAVLEQVTPKDVAEMEHLLSVGFCSCLLAEGVENLYIKVNLSGDGHTSSVELQGSHTNITRLEKDGVPLMTKEPPKHCRDAENAWDMLSIEGILEFADTVDLNDVSVLLQKQIDCNMRISEEGLTKQFGASVGRILWETSDQSAWMTEAKARAAAGSDARMNGCSVPVMINSGSGNQGITVCVPVVCYAKHHGISQNRLYRALVLSNLLAVHQKRFIGRLSAYCGAVSAACGSGAAVTYLSGGSYEQICGTVVNTVATIGGMVCDGAKSSCAAKIAAALETAFLAHRMSMRGCVFQPGEGLVKSDAERTIRSVGRMGRNGMRSTDTEILNIMLEQASSWD